MAMYVQRSILTSTIKRSIISWPGIKGGYNAVKFLSCPHMFSNAMFQRRDFRIQQCNYFTCSKLPRHDNLGRGGYYGNAPSMNSLAANGVSDLMFNAISDIQANTDTPDVFQICDFGTGDGIASSSLLYSCIEMIKRRYGEEQSIQVTYEDRPDNEFKQIFKRLSEPNSIQTDFTNVYVNTVGRSFFDQCLPSNTLHLGYSALSMQWLSNVPCNITDGTRTFQITIESELKAFEKQAKEDWEKILLQRAAEMKNGARFVFVQLHTDEKGQSNGHSGRKSIYEAKRSCLRQMVESGRITAEEYHNLTYPFYFRTREEFVAPFMDERSVVRKAGLELVSFRRHINPCELRTAWNKSPGSPIEYARKLILDVRSWSNFLYYAVFSENRKTEEESRELVDEFYENLINEIATDPPAYGMDYILAHIVIKKSLR